jgi:EmrB/QacA subfamily drug resistance transporter
VSKAIRNLMSTILFLEALDATMLYVILPKITLGFGGLLFQGDWIIIGFLLAVALAMFISPWIGSFFGVKKAFLYAQIGYILSSIACGFSNDLDQLIIFRILQGIFAGTIIPFAVNYWVSEKHVNQKEVLGCRIYFYEMFLALTLGPIYAGYVAEFISWKALFFIKVPVSIICFLISIFILQEQKIKEKKEFHWRGYLIFSLALYILIFSITEVGDLNSSYLISIFGFILAIFMIGMFIKYELTHSNPIMNFHLFKNSHFLLGIILQSITMIVFLGAIFVLSIFMIGALKFDIIYTCWIIASLGVGLWIAVLFKALIKELIPNMVLLIGSFLLLSLSMYLFTKVDRDLPKQYIALIVFLEGFAAGLARNCNTKLLFYQEKEKSSLDDISRIYIFINHVMTTIGVAITVMIVELNLVIHRIPSLSWATPEAAKKAYQLVFYILSSLPLAGILVILAMLHKINSTKSVK